MLIVFGSTLALFASLFAYSKSRHYWSVMATKLVLEMKLAILGIRENVLDKINAKYNKTDLPCKTGYVAIVTGGSRGIGEVVVKMLLQCNMEVIIACRRVEAGERAVERIRRSGVTGGKPVVYELDNASLNSVRNFAEEIKKRYTNVHILINNAGIMRPPYAETKDGFEQQWGVNYLSHFLLTALLMPVLRNAGTPENSARVINVSSCAHYLGTINFNDINYKSPYLANAAYAQSKLAQVLFTKTLDEIAKKDNLPIRCYSVHPGVVNTGIFDHSYLNYLTWIRLLLFKTPEQGATGIVYIAVNEDIDNLSGSYFSNCRDVSSNPIAQDKAVQEKLWQLSLQQTKLQDFLQYL